MNELQLSQQQRDELRVHMHDQLLALDSEITHLEILTAPVSPDNAIGRLSRLEAMNEKSINEVALKSARERVVRIRAALTRIDDELFGLCRDCDEVIPFARLKSIPGTRRCVACKENAGG